MAFDPRKIVSFMNMLPDSYVGEAGKVLVLNSAEDAFELLPMGSLKATGVIFMWPTDTPPAGALMMNDQVIAYEDYPALFAVFGLSSGTLTLKAVNFAKNSKGVNTYTDELEGVGDHNHGCGDGGAHGHSANASAAGNHRHSITDGYYESGGGTERGSGVSIHFGQWSGEGGAHGHSISVASASDHQHPILEHVGTTQPACTLLNFCIWT